MKLILIFGIFFTVTLKCAKQSKNTDATLGVLDRIAALKYQIATEIEKQRQKLSASEKIRPVDEHDSSADYVDSNVESVTPIMDDDERKIGATYKLTQLTTKQQTVGHTKKLPKRMTTKGHNVKHAKFEDMRDNNNDQRTEWPTSSKAIDMEHTFDTLIGELNVASKKTNMFDPATSTVEVFHDNAALTGVEAPRRHGAANSPVQILRNRNKKTDVSKYSDVFYRRNNKVIKIEDTEDVLTQFVHCQDMITPFLKKFKTNMAKTTRLKVTSYPVVRLTQLLGLDTSSNTKEQVYSIMYQISGLRIRLFQWDLNALKLLFNVINRENIKRHTFITIKQGIRRTLGSWHLDFSNTTNLLKQARVFRPPCLEKCKKQGSTKSSGGPRVTPPSKPRCSEEDQALCDE